MHFSTVIDFWFKELTPKQWWAKDEAFDKMIEERFSETLDAVIAGETYGWREDPKGWLAEILVLDQFSRNIYRDTPRAFAQDPQALSLAQEAISSGATEVLSAQEKVFVYMPFMHSESALMHEIAVGLFTDVGIESNIDYEHKHKAIIDRFGRYPHRNAILGRESTPEEDEFLQLPGSGF